MDKVKLILAVALALSLSLNAYFIYWLVIVRACPVWWEMFLAR